MPMNMSYCRFENTLAALRECNEALADIMNLDDLTESEARAARRLVKLCTSIAGDWEHDPPHAYNDAACGKTYTQAEVDAAVLKERARCKLIVQRNQYRNGHHEHEGTPMGHYDICMVDEIDSGLTPEA